MKLADNISYRLLTWCRGASPAELIIPNYYMGMYEMDICRITPAGIVYEYEIKISRADFKNDFKKGYTQYRGDSKNKHNSLKQGELNCNRFFFVVPQDLVKVDEIPDYAGLIYYREKSDSFTMVRTAPLIKKEKMVIDWQKLALSMAYREQNHKHKYRWEKFNHDQTMIKLKSAEKEIKRLNRHRKSKKRKD